MIKKLFEANSMRPRWRKVLSDLGGSTSRTLLVVASITVGVFAIGMIVSTYVILAEDVNLSYASVNPANIEVWTDPFHEDFARIMARVPGVTGAEGRFISSVRSRRAGEFWQSIKLVAIRDFDAFEINQLGVLEGAASPDLRAMLISENFLNNTGYQAGDMVTLELPNGTKHTLNLVGVVSDQATGGGDPTAGANAYVTMETLRAMGMGDAYNRLLVTVEAGGNEQSIEAVASLVEDRMERNQHAVYRMDTIVSNEHPMSSTILAMLGVMGALGLLITILSSTLIINTLNALLTQQMRQIGVMKLIGGSSRQILAMYMILILAYGLIALLIAVPAGAFAGYQFSKFIVFLFGAELQGFRIVPLAIILQALIAFLVPLCAGFFPVRKGSQTNVRRAISNDRPVDQGAGVGWMTRISAWLSWISRPIMLSIRNTFRQKRRLVLTIFTLTISGAVFIGVFNVRDSMAQFMDQITQHFMGDVAINFSRPYPISRIEQVILPFPGVQSLEGWGGTGSEIWDANDEVLDNMYVIAPPVDTALLNPDIVAGRWLHAGEREAVVVSDAIYEIYPDLQPGDSIRVKVPGQRADEWQVVGVFRFISMIGDTIAYADFDFVADMVDLPNQALSYKVILEEHSLEAQMETSAILDQYLKDHDFMVGSVEAGLTTQQDASEAINILIIFLLIMALLTAFVGSIGLTGTMGMNVLERTREIGVMRAIGAVDLQVIKSVVIEGILIGLITWVLAIGLSFPISFGLLRIIASAMMGSRMDLTFTPEGMLIWLGVVVLLSFLASMVPARNAARLTIREVLAYE